MPTLRSKLSANKSRFANLMHTALSALEETALMGLFQSMVLGECEGNYSVEMNSDYYFLCRIATTDYTEYGELGKLLKDLDDLKKKRGHIISKSIFIDRIDKDMDFRTKTVCQRWQMRYWDGMTIPDQIAE